MTAIGTTQPTRGLHRLATALATSAAVLLTPALAPTASAAIPDYTDCSQVAGNLIGNCGFENFLTDWTQTGDTSWSGVTSGYQHSGYSSFSAGNGTADQALSVDLTTQAGVTYDLAYHLHKAFSYLYEADNAYFTVAVDLDGDDPGGEDQLQAFDGLSTPMSQWVRHDLTFTASGPTTRLIFHTYNESFYWFLDDIAVVAQHQPWTLDGFLSPVDSTVVNTVKAGSTVPLKFRVYNGDTELIDPAIIASFTATKVACESDGTPAEEVDFTTTGNTSLRYADGTFHQNWKTPKTKGCYDVTITTTNGDILTAHFQLR